MTKALIFLVLFCAAGFAQSSAHQVTLNWADTTNPTGTTYTVYRASGACTGTSTFTQVASALAAKTYTDTSVTPGNYCYQVTAMFNFIESLPSNTAAAAVRPFPPATLTVVVQ